MIQRCPYAPIKENSVRFFSFFPGLAVPLRMRPV
jgi:hypothetical protein